MRERERERESTHKHTKRRATHPGGTVTFCGRSMKHRWRSMPAHSCTPTMPNMKNTKKHNSNTFPSMGSVSRSNMTSILIPEGGKEVDKDEKQSLVVQELKQ